MFVGTCTVKLKASWVKSLKDKRMIIKSIIQKVKNKFNVSICEIENQDIHKILFIAFCCISNNRIIAEKTIQSVVNFIECNTEAIIYDIDWQID